VVEEPDRHPRHGAAQQTSSHIVARARRGAQAKLREGRAFALVLLDDAQRVQDAQPLPPELRPVALLLVRDLVTLIRTPLTPLIRAPLPPLIRAPLTPHTRLRPFYRRRYPSLRSSMRAQRASRPVGRCACGSEPDGGPPWHATTGPPAARTWLTTRFMCTIALPSFLIPFFSAAPAGTAAPTGPAGASNAGAGISAGLKACFMALRSPARQASRHDARKNGRAVRLDMEGLHIGGVVALEREANNR
jgi:hypothetical protein